MVGVGEVEWVIRRPQQEWPGVIKMVLAMRRELCRRRCTWMYTARIVNWSGAVRLLTAPRVWLLVLERRAEIVVVWKLVALMRM